MDLEVTDQTSLEAPEGQRESMAILEDRAEILELYLEFTTMAEAVEVAPARVLTEIQDRWDLVE